MKKVLISFVIILILIALGFSTYFFFIPWWNTKNFDKFENQYLTMFYPKGYQANVNNNEKNMLFGNVNEREFAVIIFNEDPGDVDFVADYPNLNDSDCLGFEKKAQTDSSKSEILEAKAIDNFFEKGCTSKNITINNENEKMNVETKFVTNKFPKKIKSYLIIIMYKDELPQEKLNELRIAKDNLYLK